MSNVYKLLAIFTVTVVFASTSLTTLPAEESKPNVILFLVDDLGWADLACYGNKFNESPAIDRLAAQGARFTDFYAACPVCSPTRASIQSGQYQARYNLTDFISGHWRPFEQVVTPPNAPALPLEIETIAELLQKQGYATGYYGKWHLGPGQTHNPDAQGYDEWVVTGGRHFAPRFRTTPHQEVKSGTAQTDFLTDKTIDFIRDHKADPFFVQLSHYAVHIPLEAKPGDIEKYNQKEKPTTGVNNVTYAAMIEDVDRSLDRIVKTLDDLELSNNTLVIFTSDNGGLNTRYDGGPQVASQAPLRGEKGNLYEGGIRVPMILRWPGKIAKGQTIADPSITVDLYATIASAVGIKTLPAKTAADSVNLLDRVTGAAKALQRDAIFWHYPHYHHSRPASAIRAGSYKLIEFLDNGDLELYDLSQDIGETKNLAQEKPAETKRLYDMLETWRVEVDAGKVVLNPKYDPRRAGQWWSRRTKEPLGTQDALEPGFIRLFNGQTLDGWTGDPNLWSVQDHAITGQSDTKKPIEMNTFLAYTKQEFGDFELRLHYRIFDIGTGFANSGVQYRSSLRKDLGEFTYGGYQADIDLTNKYSGILYDEKGRGILGMRGDRVELATPSPKNKKKKVIAKVVGSVGDSKAIAEKIFPPEKWNRYTIIAKGNRFIHKINGVVTTDVTDNDKAGFDANGYIALQLHKGPAMKVQFKNVRIKPLVDSDKIETLLADITDAPNGDVEFVNPSELPARSASE